MKWPTIDEMSTLAPLPEGYRYERLSRAQIPALIAGIKEWHPDIAVGAGSCYLREDFYTDKVFLDGEAEKDICVLLWKHGGDLIGMWSMEREPDALAIYGRLMLVAATHRDSNVIGEAVMGSEQVARAMGVQYMYALATLRNLQIQLALERARWQLIALTLGYDRELVAPGVVKHVYDAVYAKVLAPEQELLWPEPKNLTPKTRALFELLFPMAPKPRGDHP